MGSQVDPDQLLAALADKQHGVVGRVQALALGLTARAITRRIERGRLHAVHRGVYAVGRRSLTREGRWMAAVLACGDDAVLSHATAANIWGLRRSEASRIDVTVSRGGRKPHKGLRIHRVGTLRDQDRTLVGVLPVTTPARTLFDLAAVVPQRALERALEEAEARHIDTSGLATLLAAHPSKHGAPKLRAALEMHGAGGLTLTRSDLEELFLKLCDDHGLPRPRVNEFIGDYEADFHWPAGKLIVEADSRRHHDTTPAFERDRRRDGDLLVHGWATFRVTHARLVREPAAVARQLAAVLTARSAAGTARPS